MCVFLCVCGCLFVLLVYLCCLFIDGSLHACDTAFRCEPVCVCTVGACVCVSDEVNRQKGDQTLGGANRNRCSD